MDPDALVADLDADQRAAVTTEARLVAVIAGAGSGKTRVLTRRIAHRIATGSADARHTLALTFTREAAGELRRRLRRMGMRDPVEAGTFHSVMLGILRQRWEDTDRRPSNVVPDRRRLVRDVIGDARRYLDACVNEIDWAAARGLTPAEYAAAARRSGRRPPAGIDHHAQVLADYAALKHDRGIVDFDDVLALVARDMEYDTSFGDAVRWRFRHLLVDEAQDLNPLQTRLVDLLRHGRDDLFLVGDPAQAIYGFNGADPTLLVDVDRRFPGVEVVRLPGNHRCTPEIVAAGVHVLRQTGPADDLHSNRADGAAVEVLAADDELDEARRVARWVLAADPNLIRTREIAVLARTNAQLAVLADALRECGIDVRRSAAATGSPLQLTVRQVASNGSAARLRGWAHDTLEELDRREPAARPDDAPPDGPDDVIRRVALAVLDFLRENPHGDGAGFRSWVATTNPFDDGSAGGVELLTFHGAKGREWHSVAVTGVETSLVPYKSATTAGARAEEARLLYVAMTRATDRLVLTHARRRHGYQRAVSPFIATLDLTPTPTAPPPPLLRRAARPHDPVEDAVRTWRDETARRAHVLPAELCSDRDLDAIVRARPTTADELAEVTSLGPLTAARLAPSLTEAITTAVTHGV